MARGGGAGGPKPPKKIRVKAVIVENDDGKGDRMIWGKDMRCSGTRTRRLSDHFFSGG